MKKFFLLLLAAAGALAQTAVIGPAARDNGKTVTLQGRDLSIGTAAGASSISINNTCTGWTLGTGWSCNSGSLVLASGNTGVASYHSAATQVSGKVLQLTISAVVPAYSSIMIAHCGAGIPGLSVGTISARTTTYTCTDTSDLQLIPGAYTTSAVTISAISVKVVSGGGLSANSLSLVGNSVPSFPDQTARLSKSSPLSLANELNLSLFDGGAGTEWVGTGGTAPADDTTHLLTSGKHILLGSTNNANSRMDKTATYNLTGYVAIRFQYYVDDPTQLTQVQFFFASDNGYANYYSCTRNASGILTGWNDLTILTSACTTGAGAPNWNNIVKIRANVLAPAAKTVNVTFGGLWMVANPTAKATIILTFDDGDASVFSIAKNTLAANKMAGTAFVIPNVLGTGAYYMTLGQVQTLQDKFGWDIACHTADHALLTTIPAASIDEQFDRWHRWAATNQIKRVPVIAYPQGSFNSTVITEAQKYFLFGRLAGWPGPATGMVDPIPFQYQLPVQSVQGPGSQTSLATAQGWVDTALTSNSILILVFHNILTTPVAATDWPTSDFNSLIAYIQTKVVAGTAQVLTFSQLIRLYFPGAV